MGLNIWTKEDVINILSGIELASLRSSEYGAGCDVESFREGFRSALLAVAASFGVLTSTRQGPKGDGQAGIFLPGRPR